MPVCSLSPSVLMSLSLVRISFLVLSFVYTCQEPPYPYCQRIDFQEFQSFWRLDNAVQAPVLTKNVNMLMNFWGLISGLANRRKVKGSFRHESKRNSSSIRPYPVSSSSSVP